MGPFIVSNSFFLFSEIIVHVRCKCRLFYNTHFYKNFLVTAIFENFHNKNSKNNKCVHKLLKTLKNTKTGLVWNIIIVHVKAAWLSRSPFNSPLDKILLRDLQKIFVTQWSQAKLLNDNLEIWPFFNIMWLTNLRTVLKHFLSVVEKYGR